MPTGAAGIPASGDGTTRDVASPGVYRLPMRTLELERRAQVLVHAQHRLEAFCLAFDGLVRQAVAFEVAAWSTQDPATGLFTSCTMSGMEKDHEREAQLFRYEFVDDEPSTYPSLIRDGQTVAVLSEVTGGDLERAARYRHLLKAFGITDELRAVLWADGRPWGSATLYRRDGRFTPQENQAVATLAPVAAEGLRLVLLRAAASRPEAVTDPPGIVEVSSDGRVRPLTTPGAHWLAIGGPQLVTTANATAAAVRERQDWAGATARLLLDGGRMLTLHAATMTPETGTVAVIVDAARPMAVGEMLVDAYGLTPRQRDVLGLLLLGRSLTRIARELALSEHTVNDHRKAIYRRLNVASRSELAALLQAEQYGPRSQAGLPPSPYGGFLTFP